LNPDVINHFVHRSAAQRYASARPYFHPLVCEKIAAFIERPRVTAALDVACGTGQSARALAKIAQTVEAVDISPAMLGQAEPAERVQYQVARAEALPFADGVFDLLTVGLLHWFDQGKFLAEAHRILDRTGWLIIYTSGFHGEMAENPAFRSWAWETYPARFPTPPRKSAPIDAALASGHGFDLRGSESFSHDEIMSAEALTGYLLTQTNVIAAVENGSTPLAEAATWIAEGISPFFGEKPQTMKFGGTIWYMKRVERARSEQPKNLAVAKDY
jgi:SAM-dependent methyltransferase